MNKRGIITVFLLVVLVVFGAVFGVKKFIERKRFEEDQNATIYDYTKEASTCTSVGNTNRYCIFTVRDENGNSIKDATLELYESHHLLKASAVSNSEGKAGFCGMEDETYYVQLTDLPEGFRKNDNVEYIINPESGASFWVQNIVVHSDTENENKDEDTKNSDDSNNVLDNTNITNNSINTEETSKGYYEELKRADSTEKSINVEVDTSVSNRVLDKQQEVGSYIGYNVFINDEFNKIQIKTIFDEPTIDEETNIYSIIGRIEIENAEILRYNVEPSNNKANSDYYDVRDVEGGSVNYFYADEKFKVETKKYIDGGILDITVLFKYNGKKYKITYSQTIMIVSSNSKGIIRLHSLNKEQTQIAPDINGYILYGSEGERLVSDVMETGRSALITYYKIPEGWVKIERIDAENGNKVIDSKEIYVKSNMSYDIYL